MIWYGIHELEQKMAKTNLKWPWLAQSWRQRSTLTCNQPSILKEHIAVYCKLKLHAIIWSRWIGPKTE